ncbi:MAG: YfcE family phosphodiesterase [Eubacteriales bacterium]|jgi:putative phosphoesterase|nr:YfcE family phosphodiesterase [Clostridiales bacterium]
MKAVILSDSHGDMSRLRKVMKMHDDADVFVHLGDGVREFAAAAALLKDKRIISVAGNCDIFYQGEMPPSEVVTQLDGFVFFFTHRHKYRVKYSDIALIARARELGADAVFYGHTHVAHCEYMPPRDGTGEKPLYVVCPGSIGRSVGGRPSYAIAETYKGQLICRTAEL